MPGRAAAAVLVVAFLGGVAAGPAFGAKGQRRWCRSGRFLGARLFPDADGRMLIVLADGRLAIGDRCRATQARMTKVRGGMRVVARWASCDDGSRNVRVKAVLARNCGRLTGTLRLGKLGRRLDAPASTCGDAWVDSGMGEFCDSTSDCTSDCRRIGSTACRGPFDSTWQGLESVVFESRGCTSSLCHGGASQGGLDLRPDAAYANLVNAPSPLGGMPRVLPGDEQQSFLWRKLAAKTRGLPGVPGTPMPSGLPGIPDDELEALRLWIRAGAPETGTIGPADTLLAACPPQGGPPPPASPPPPPPADQGVQLFAPGWTIPPHGENEVCFATYYDFSSQIPAEFQADCPPFWGAGRKCFYYDKTELTQDPNSHHSIIHAYKGAEDITHPSFGPFTCHGGAKDATPCNPKGIGVPAPDGADCGADSGCAGRARQAVNCIGYGPPDYGFDTGGGTANSPQIGGAQQAHIVNAYAAGVYSTLPVQGILVWNSHAFNTTDQPEMNRQWFDLFFAGPGDRQYPAQAIFDLDQIFVQSVPVFTQREYCNTLTLPPGSRLFYLSSHTHKRGKLFRAWTPPNAACSPGPGCLPESRSPDLVTARYSDPAQVYFDPPLVLGGNVASRTIKYCALYDNGLTNPGEVKRRSTSPSPPFFLAPGGPCAVSETACLGGPHEGTTCGGNDAVCAPGGACDACPLRGGVTTEDEMFILLGSYYTLP